MPKNTSVEILKVYGYREARVRGTPVPREVFQFVQDTLGPTVKDNHQVLIVRLSNEIQTYRVVLYFTDSTVVVGNPDEVVVQKYWPSPGSPVHQVDTGNPDIL